jgi:hypothetical protein
MAELVVHECAVCRSDQHFCPSFGASAALPRPIKLRPYRQITSAVEKVSSRQIHPRGRERLEHWSNEKMPPIGVVIPD